MALIDFHIPEAVKAIESRIEDGLVVVGAACVGFASDQLRANGSVVTGNLVNSITYATSTTQGPVQGKTNGTAIEVANKAMTVRVGTNVVYARRVEFGFTGKDSKGRTYNQPAKSYLRAGIMANKGVVIAVLAKAAHG